MTFPPYIEPITNQSSTISFTNKTPLTPSWFTFKNQNTCQGRLWFKRNIDDFSGTTEEYKVKSGTPFTLFSSLEYNRTNSCNVISRFTPKAGLKYNIEFVVNDQHCNVHVKDSLGKEIHHTLNQKVTPLSESGSWCGDGEPNNVFKTYYLPIIL